MSLIWNNKEYKLVSDDSEWDRLEYVISRKLHVQYTSTQTVTIDLIKKSFTIYGAIEKIEIFREKNTKIQFVHVTFKESRASYLALIDYKQNVSAKIKFMRPAYSHQQPDNSICATKSSFDVIPDECLLKIFQKLDYLTIAKLSVVSKKLCRLIKENIFGNMCKFENFSSTDAEVEEMLIAANRIIKCLDPKSFHMKIYRDLTKSQQWPTIVVDFCYTEQSRLSIEMEFYAKRWLSKLQSIAKFINVIHFRCTIYDDLLPYKEQDKVVWPNATILIVSGYSTRIAIPDFSPVVASLPKLKDLFIRNLVFDFDMQNYCHGKHLRKISFENCLFSWGETEEMLWKVVEVVKQKKNDFPLCIKFDCFKRLRMASFSDCYNRGSKNGTFNQKFQHEHRSRKFASYTESTYNEIKMIVRDRNASKFVRFEIGDDSFSDLSSCGSAHGVKRCRFDAEK